MEPIIEQIVSLVNVTESILVKSKSIHERQVVIDFFLMLVILSVGYYMLQRFLHALIFMIVTKQDLLVVVISRTRLLLMTCFLIHIALLYFH